MTSRQATPPRALAVIAIAVAISAFVACSDNNAPTPQPIAGTYDLVTISGSSLPAQYGPSSTDSVTDDVYHINGDGTYDRLGHQRMYVSGQMRTLDDIDSGTVVRGSGTGITLKSRIHGTMQMTGSIDGSVMTLNRPPGVFVYHRR